MKSDTRTVKIDDAPKKFYDIRFDNLTDLHDYLTVQKPPINENIFKKLASLNPNEDFFGKPFDEAVEYCIKGYSGGNFDNFLITNMKLSESFLDLTGDRRLVKSFYGGVPLAPLAAANVPECMLRYDIDEKSYVRNIYVAMNYPSYTSAEAVVNRGLAVLYLLQTLEAKNEMVNLHTISLQEDKNEIIGIDVGLKRPGEPFTDIKKCYFPLVGIEFLRRVIFRVIETTAVESSSWGVNYGRPCRYDEYQQLYNLTDKDIVILPPLEIGISGENIYDDTISMIEHLNLENEFDIDKIKKLKYKNL